MSHILTTDRLILSYEPDIETLDWIGGGRCGVYYLWLGSTSAGAISMTSTSSACGEIGYEMEPEYRGLGYATEALAAVVGIANQFHRFTLLSARAYAGNTASRRVLEKTGFTPVSSKLEWCDLASEPVSIIKYRRVDMASPP